MKFEIPNGSINGFQVESIKRLLESCKGMHYADVQVRKGGKDLSFQADWLRHVVITEDNETVRPIRESSGGLA